MSFNKPKPNILSLYFILNQFGGTRKKWTKLHHNGVIFPPEYVSHNIPLIYDNKEINLVPAVEEVATFYAKYIGTPYVENKTFNKNYWIDFKKILDKYMPNSGITDFTKIDFRLIHNYLEKIKEEKKNISSEQKEIEREEKQLIDEKYKYAYIDDKKEPVGNFRVEPPGIFLGRGTHPKIGKLKKRVYPEDVTLNLSIDAPIPSTIDGHTWGYIVHDRTVDWLASWKDPISGKLKYVWLGTQSSLKGQNDMEKFDLARKLKKRIKTIRAHYEEDMHRTGEENKTLKEIATAVYLIDTFALRVGNEKGDDVADTVGVTSLRNEHITLMPNDMIKLDFLGKDSVRYLNIAHVPKIVYDNLEEFMKGKTKNDNVFDISSNDINKYLQQFQKDLTAKVFRTYNASYIFSKELRKITAKMENYKGDDASKLKILLDLFNKANIKVAKTMNHQKNIAKSHSQQLGKLNEQITELKNSMKNDDSLTPAKISKIKRKIKGLKNKKQVKNETKNISLGTSKINYIDPRITVAFIKQNNIPPEKLFTKALMDKFKWAFSADKNFIF